jgi:quinohemoprotein ethanol dehydrogenase
MKKAARPGLVALIMAVIAAGAPVESASPAAQLPTIDSSRDKNADRAPGNWLTHGRTYQEDRFSPLDEINDQTVKRLGLAWFYDLDTDRGQEATPLVLDGVMYTTSAWSKVFALDAATGKLLWSYDPEVKGRKGYEACCDVVNRGVALWNGKVYLGALDGRLIALDAVTGKPVWSVQTTDTSQQYTITGAPRVVRGKVLIGNGGAELGVRGFVSAYDAETGTLVWRFYTAPNPTGESDHAASDKVFAKFAGASWGKDGAWKQVGGGGTVWDAIVYDQDINQILIGVGSGSPWSRRLRSGDDGDNLFLSSIVALDPDTGAYKWHYQEVPGEEWDFDATQSIILADVKIDGTPRKVLFQAAKDGFFYVIDRETGKPISATKFVPENWSDGYDTKTWRPKVRPEARYSENGNDFLALASAYGAHNWQPMAYSPKTGLVYIPVQLIPFGYADDKAFKYVAGRWNLGDASAHNVGPRNAAGQAALKAMAKGRLLAWDPVKGKARFAVEHPGPGYGGVLATAGNLVFQGGPDGRFTAYRADTGKKLWDFDGQSGIIAGPIAFEAGGQQFVAVMAGLGGSFGVSSTLAPDPHKRPNGRVLVFKLSGTASLPSYTPPVMPAQVPDETFQPALQAKGEEIYAGNCGLCHGPSTYSNGVIPDLRRSAAILSQDAFNAIVLEGALEPRGMIGFSKWLSQGDTAAIRAYIAGQAKAMRAQEIGGAAVGKMR